MGVELSPLRFSIRKLRLIQNSIEHLSSGDFPHTDSNAALELVSKRVEELLVKLERTGEDATPELKLSVCQNVNLNIIYILKFLGVILRSTNVRNAFELYVPLKHLATTILGADTKLILSSEWNFSPFTYPKFTKFMPGYIVIGLPASESSNALTIPLAGHELGHSVWRHRQLEEKFRVEIHQSIVRQLNEQKEKYVEFFPDSDSSELETDLAERARWHRSYRWSIKQCEEIFCDLIGLRIFGQGFLLSFAYLLSPMVSPSRYETYPSARVRTEFLVAAAKKLGVQVPDNYESIFQTQKENSDSINSFFLRIADQASLEMFEQLCDEAFETCDKCKIPLEQDDEIKKILTYFSLGSPMPDTASFASLVTAGWRAFLDPKILGVSNNEVLKSDIYLNELILKSCEVLEVNLLTKVASAKKDK